MTQQEPVYYINGKCPDADTRLALQLQTMLAGLGVSGFPVILCIGTDRVTGDSLGPLAGSFLEAYGAYHPLTVYGTLDAPVHALNLSRVMRRIKNKHPRSPILAVDASLGARRHVGYITLGKGSLSPGAGVQKSLDPVGDLFITGIINTASWGGQLTLQNHPAGPCGQTGLLYCPGNPGSLRYSSTRPSRARSSVISSIYSRSPPTGTPLAILLTLIPVGLISLLRYMAVVSPSRLELVAIITSFTSP